MRIEAGDEAAAAAWLAAFEAALGAGDAAGVAGLFAELLHAGRVGPQGDFFDPTVLLAVLCSVMFASYSVMTRMAGMLDPPLTSFFYTGVVGCLVVCLVGPFYWTNMAPLDWAWIATLCLTSVTSHFLLIKAYNILDASAVQPLAYLSVVYASVMGPVIFHETVHLTTYAGAAIVVAGGLLSIWSERRRRG